jgi:hypothetical protein
LSPPGAVLVFSLAKDLWHYWAAAITSQEDVRRENWPNATDGCGQGGVDRHSDGALPYRVRPRSIILGMRSARFAIGGAAGVRDRRYLQESPAHLIDRTIREVHHDRFRRKDDHS